MDNLEKLKHRKLKAKEAKYAASMFTTNKYATSIVFTDSTTTVNLGYLHSNPAYTNLIDMFFADLRDIADEETALVNDKLNAIEVLLQE